MTEEQKSETPADQPTAKPEVAASQTGPQDVEFSEAGRIIGSGFAMGSADVVPGVSGGTMAVACGIYEELLAAIASIDGQVIKALLRLDIAGVMSRVHWRFLVLLFSGVLSAVVVAIKIIGLPHLLVDKPTQVYSVFFGLVLASVFILGKKIPWGGLQVPALVAGALFGFGVVNLVPVETPSNPFFMFLYGTVAISAMLLPGISGSFILLILRQYETIIGAVERLLHLDFSALLIVVPFALGCLVGIAVFSRLVAWMLRKYHNPVIAGLCGLLVGSLWRIWPYQDVVTAEVRGKTKVVEATPFLPEALDVTVLLLVVAGFAAVFLVEFLASRRTPSAS